MNGFYEKKAWEILAGRKSGKIALLSAFPNAFLPFSGKTLTIKGVDENLIKALTNSGIQVVSYVGHSATASLFSARLGIEVSVCRDEATLGKDLILIGAFTPPRRLAEGETWTEGEILSMQIKWLMI